LKALEEAIGYRFKDQGLLRQALTHRSYTGEHPQARHNERLEFLGDAVLALVVSAELYKAGLDEAQMSKARAFLVKAQELASLAEQLGLGEHLLLGRGEVETGGRRKRSILAGALEALIGAVYLDGGLRGARAMVRRLYKKRLKELLSTGRFLDAKTELQEVCQRQMGVLPSYRVLRAEGLEHRKLFTVGVYVRGRLLGKGRGPSKKEAQQEAAQKALRKLAAP
jgi:ribonuclease-3